MGADDVGGQEILDNVKRNFIEMFQNALSISMSHLCYCKEPLRRTTSERPFIDWRCTSCSTNQCGRVAFDCINEKCLFKSLSGSIYVICPMCFESASDDEGVAGILKQEEDAENTYIYRQINRSINIISSDYLYSYTCISQFNG